MLDSTPGIPAPVAARPEGSDAASTRPSAAYFANWCLTGPFKDRHTRLASGARTCFSPGPCKDRHRAHGIRTPTAAGRSEDDHAEGEQKLQLSDVVTWLGEASTALRKQLSPPGVPAPIIQQAPSWYIPAALPFFAALRYQA